jgi:hypothetical protein
MAVTEVEPLHAPMRPTGSSTTSGRLAGARNVTAGRFAVVDVDLDVARERAAGISGRTTKTPNA